jgi:transcriptional regulator with PAS, ATPase and Fis domain
MQMAERAGSRFDFEGMIGRSPGMTETFRRLRLAAHAPGTLLLSGESGTGKELAAAAIHSLSPRKGAPFIAVNCSALPEPLLESELFGHVKGAFTGADRDRTGLFQAAHGGTLFLDEVAELSPALQVKVLRALQEREIRRVGSEKALKVDVRIIAASNRDLRELVSREQMREDFYYRIAVFEIRLPPLRERRDDIPVLAARFIDEFARSTGKPVKTIAPSAMRTLLEYPWPGNVRELRNAVEHAFVLASGPVLRLVDFPPALFPPGARRSPARRYAARSGDPAEEDRLRNALQREGGNRAAAARSLGMSRVTLWHKMKQYGIDA